MIDADGTEHNVASSELQGWFDGALLNGNYTRGFEIIMPDGDILHIRYNMVEGSEWEEEIEGESALYNQVLLLEWTADLDMTVIEVFFSIFNDYPDRASGTITCHLNANTSAGPYDLIGSLNPNYALEKCNEGSKPTSMRLFVREA